MERLAEASAAEAKAANAVWQAAQAHAANSNEPPVSDDSQPAENYSEGSDVEGDVRLHPRAVCLLNLVHFILKFNYWILSFLL